jgi:hypothetical protein
VLHALLELGAVHVYSPCRLRLIARLALRER